MVDARADKILIKFDNWSSKWNTWFRRRSLSLMPRLSKANRGVPLTAGSTVLGVDSAEEDPIATVSLTGDNFRNVELDDAAARNE